MTTQKRRAYYKIWRAKPENKEKIRLKNAQWNKANKAKKRRTSQRWYRRNRRRQYFTHKRWVERNRERMQYLLKRWWSINFWRRDEYNERYYAKHPWILRTKISLDAIESGSLYAVDNRTPLTALMAKEERSGEIIPRKRSAI